MGILDGIVEWIAKQVMNGLDLISTSVLGALGCDMGTFLRYFPAAETMYKVFVATAIGLVLLNWVWQLFKNFGLIAGVEAEDPFKLSTSDQDSTFDFLSSLFMSFVFIKLVRYADKYGDGGKLPVPVHILADELANGGCTIADLTKKISTIRSRQLSISCIFQNLPQMQNRYPLNQWQEIIGNCDTQLFLGCTDELTAEFISNRTGEVSVAVSSQAKQLNTWRVSDYTPEYRETHSVGKRKLMTADEVLRLPLDEALIILRGQKVLKVGKFDYTLHPESGKLRECRASDHVPAWRRLPETEEPDFSRLMTPKPKPKAPRKKPVPEKPVSGNPYPETPDTPPTPPPQSKDCKIVMSDKKSIMS